MYSRPPHKLILLLACQIYSYPSPGLPYAASHQEVATKVRSCLDAITLLTYSMETRTRKVIRRHVSGDGGGTRKRPKVFDREEYYYRRHSQRKQSKERNPPTYRIIETTSGPLRSRASLNTPWKRDLSPARSQPFKVRLPYIKRVAPARDDYEPRPRGRARSPRPFVVDPVPEIRYAWPKGERLRALSPEIRYISPRRKPSPRRISPRPLERERERIIVDDTPREARPLERGRGPRPPRERTPVVERGPVRRRPHAVEIHQSPERRERGGSTRRQVRFAEEEYGDRPRGRNEYSQSESDDDIREEIRRCRRAREDIDDRPRYRYLSPERATYRRTELETTVRSRRSETSRLRPRIIQDGDREISEAGDRIYDAARRRDQERDLHDFVPHSSSRWRRRFDDIRDFSSDDDSYVSSRRYSRRWR
ncbi:hypothetical protein BJX76DRAFT_343004 [Aspergillus varians]